MQLSFGYREIHLESGVYRGPGQQGKRLLSPAAIDNVKLWTFRRASESGEPKDMTMPPQKK
jgi:hypothetical protein